MITCVSNPIFSAVTADVQTQISTAMFTLARASQGTDQVVVIAQSYPGQEYPGLDFRWVRRWLSAAPDYPGWASDVASMLTADEYGNNTRVRSGSSWWAGLIPRAEAVARFPALDWTYSFAGVAVVMVLNDFAEPMLSDYEVDP